MKRKLGSTRVSSNDIIATLIDKYDLLNPQVSSKHAKPAMSK